MTLLFHDILFILLIEYFRSERESLRFRDNFFIQQLFHAKNWIKQEEKEVKAKDQAQLSIS